MTSGDDARRERESRPEGRRAAHTARIAAAEPGSVRHRWLVMSWLQVEVRAGGDIDRVYQLAEQMNREAAQRRLERADRSNQTAA